MKKKGLIISTIVMVVVLIASLTTATYAWFNAQASASVKNIDVAVGTSSKVLIGVKQSSFTSAWGTSAPSFKNGSTAYSGGTAGKIDGTFSGSNGLGMSIDLQAKLSSLGGVYTAVATTDGSAFDANAATLDTTHYFCQSNYTGTGLGVGTATVKGAAAINSSTANANKGGEVIFAPFGVRAAQANLLYMWCDITVETTAEYWGIVTALHLNIVTDGGSFNGCPFDLVDTDAGTEGVQPMTWDNETSYSTDPVTITFRVLLVNNGIDEEHTAMSNATNGKIYKCQIIAFLDGYSANCVADATPFPATLKISFDASETAPTGGETIHNLTIA